MEIGRRIYYDKPTGNVIVDTGERRGSVVETSIAQDFAAYATLADREPETVGVLQLDYGQYAQDFSECNGFRVNISGEEPTLEFSYPDPGNLGSPPVFQPPLSVEVAQLKTENEDLKGRVSDMELAFADLITGGGV